MYTVYMHICPNGKKYIGITMQSVKKRWANGLGYRRQKYFFNAILKYGWDNIEHIVVASGLSKQDAGALERKLINKHKTSDRKYGYNNSLGGEYSRYGVKDLHYNQRESNPASKSVVCVELNVVFNTMTDAHEKMSVDVSAIAKCCKGQRKSAGGYHWRYKDTD
jgi:predicted GIY-YIG superfamily endonuclease